jgi:putative hydrolase of the HAD superfamily
VVTSEEAGVKKPLAGIFNYAFEKSGANPRESIMIGDDYEVDILGAQRAGMNQILFDPHENYNGVEVTYKIKNLKEIETIL